jgi:hypothetical protein
MHTYMHIYIYTDTQTHSRKWMKGKRKLWNSVEIFFFFRKSWIYFCPDIGHAQLLKMDVGKINTVWMVSQICGSDAGVPDGTFLYQKSQFWSNLEGLGMENIDILFGHLEYCSAIWYMLFPFYIFCGHLVFFSAVWVSCTICHHSRKSVLEWNVALARGGQGLRIRIVRLWVRIPVRVKSVKTCYTI